jgi:hypothetical protein
VLALDVTTRRRAEQSIVTMPYFALLAMTVLKGAFAYLRLSVSSNFVDRQRLSDWNPSGQGTDSFKLSICGTSLRLKSSSLIEVDVSVH